MNRDIMKALIADYQKGNPDATLLLEVAVRNAVDLALIREIKEQNEEKGDYDDDYYQLRQELDEEIDDLLPSIKALHLTRSPIPVNGEWK